MSYDTMEAGREMDALVAEKIMGLVPCQNDCHKIGSPRYLPGLCHAQPDSPDEGGETAQYSTSISAAWEVVEKMWDRGYMADVYQSDCEGTWSAEFLPKNDMDSAGVEWGGSMAPTAPLAICRAALKAVTG